MKYKIDPIYAAITSIFILTGCTSSQEDQKQIEILKPVKAPDLLLRRSSSLADIEGRVRDDLKKIGKTDQEISDYLVEWRKQNSHLIQ